MYSTEVKKTAVLMENFRRAIGLRIKEAKEARPPSPKPGTPHQTPSAVRTKGCEKIGKIILFA